MKQITAAMTGVTAQLLHMAPTVLQRMERPPLQESYADHRAYYGLRAGYRNQGNRRKSERNKGAAESLRGENGQNQGMRHHDDEGGHGGKLHNASTAHGRDDFLGVGEYAEGYGKSAEEKELLGSGQREEIEYMDVRKVGNRDKHPHDGGYVVGAQGVGAEYPGKKKSHPCQVILCQHVRLPPKNESAEDNVHEH